MNSNSNVTVPTVSWGSLAARWLGLALVVSVAAVGGARADQIDDYVTAKISKTRFFNADDPRNTYIFSTDAQGRRQFAIEDQEGKVGQPIRELNPQK